MSLTVSFFLVIFLIGWAFSGYFSFLLCFCRAAQQIKDAGSKKPLKISIIVPIYNEADLIKRKIENLSRLRYPDLEVLLCDASTDGTPQAIQDLIPSLSDFHLVRVPQKGRSFQNNAGLVRAKGDLVVLTDVDAMMPEDALEKLNAHFQDPQVGLVGAFVEPESPHKLDRLFWDSQNAMRLIESSVGHASVVSGACYAFRRGMIPSIPEGVWAEDIFIPFTANTKGYKVVYDPAVRVKEIRSPKEVGAFLTDKSRKGKDNIKEILRFLPEIHNMKGVWRIIFLTRFLQVILLPFLLLGGGVLVFFQTAVVLWGAFFFLALLCLGQRLLCKRFLAEVREGNVLGMVFIGAVTLIALFSSMFLFLTQGDKAHYQRVAGVRDETPRH